jgi:hypothetical protein
MGELVEGTRELSNGAIADIKTGDKPRISRPLRRYSNGALADPVTGKIVGADVGGNSTWIQKGNSEQATALARRRWDKAREAFANGMVQQMVDTGLMPNISDLDAGAMQVLGDKTAQMLLDADNARGYSELLQTAIKTAGWAPTQADRDAPAPGIVRLDVDANTLLDMLRTVRAEAEARDVVDADIVE